MSIGMKMFSPVNLIKSGFVANDKWQEKPCYSVSSQTI